MDQKKPLSSAPSGIAALAPQFPEMKFSIPASVVSAGFSYTIFGKTAAKGDKWFYWDAQTGAYADFGASSTGKNVVCLNTPVLSTGHNVVSVSLPTDQNIISGIVVMFIGPSSGVVVTNGKPAVPTPATNPSDVYGIFELSYNTATATESATLDVDISNIDQVSFTFTVTSSPSAPYPLGKVGSPISTSELMGRFKAQFPEQSAFSDCLGSASGPLTAPQDILKAVSPPVPPSYLAPTGVPVADNPFTAHSYFYAVSETSPSGETAVSPAVFGGFLLGKTGAAQAKGINIGWQIEGTPSKYIPVNKNATGINLYRASVAPVSAGGTIPVSPSLQNFGLVTSMSIDEWNAQPGFCFFDDSVSITKSAPVTSSYGFNALSTWFDAPLQQFFDHYQSSVFSFHQYAQEVGSHGTLWMGKVVTVTPKQGAQIPNLSFIDETGATKTIDFAWQWGDGTQTYLALQLVGNAYDVNDLSQTSLTTKQTLQAGEYQGAVVHIYFPYFVENTDLTQLTLPVSGSVYAVPYVPSWLTNSSWTPSAMVFGCTGVFSSLTDADAIAQNADFPGLSSIALPALENVVVSAFNRGMATGYGFALGALQYISFYQFKAAASIVQNDPDNKLLPAGTYSYFLSGVLQNGAETALSWSQSITLDTAANVTLTWSPQSPALYKAANIYRQATDGECILIGSVDNNAAAPAVTFTDKNSKVAQPTTGAPFAFYPGWIEDNSVKSNFYSAFLHQNWSHNLATGISLNGLVYGYPFDDQGNFSTNINYGTALPKTITIDIMPLS